MWALIICVLELLLLFSYLFVGRRKYSAFLKEQAYPFQLKWLLPASLLLLDQTKLMERLPDFTARVHHKLITLYGRSFALNGSKMFYAELVSAGYTCLLAFSLLSLVSDGDLTLAGLGGFGAAVVPLLLVRELDTKIRKKQRQMILELPEVLNTIILLVNAGETVGRAWMRCADTTTGKADSPLRKELAQAVRELEMSIPFSKVLEDFSKRCALQEVSLFTSAMLLNYKRGGSDFVTALQSLSIELWQRRKAVSRTLGEEASSKLVFPMVLIFVVVMIIVAAPALIIMKQ